MCYAKYHTIDNYALQEITYIVNSVMLTISGHETTSPFDI